VANYTLDLILIVVFALVQWRITSLVLAARPHRAVRYGMLAFDVLIVISYSFTFSVALAWLRIPTRAGMILGAGSLAYLMTATAVIVLHFILKLIRRQLDADTNPARRRAERRGERDSGHALRRDGVRRADPAH